MENQTVTMFDNCLTKQCREVTWQEVFEMVRSEALRTKTEAVRAMSSGIDVLPDEERRRREKEVKRMKSTWFPGIMPACHCSDNQRKLELVTSYTGFCQADFDHIPADEVEAVKTRLREVPEVMFMHTSMRGEGLHVFFRLMPDPSESKKARSYQDIYVQGYRQGNIYLAEKAGVPYDKALEPPVHLSCINYDPDAYYNPDAGVFQVDMEHPVDQNGQGVMENGQIRKRRKKGGRKRGGDEGKTKAEHIEEFLKGQSLRYDVLSRKVQTLVETSEGILWQELTERGMNDLYIACCKSLGLNLNFHDFKHVLNSGIVPEVNPLREYIKALPEWDGVDHIAEVAGMVKTLSITGAQGEGLLWSTCFKKWFVAMVASWMRDEVVNHQVLVLIGEQGIYKTTWLDALMPPELVQYRCRQSSARAVDKDEQLRATEFGLINMDEIDRMSEQELNALKSLITASDINVRAAYAIAKERRLRVASYVASGNKERFLTDTTGNRRWLPFHVTAITSPFAHPMPYAQMYAQAWALVQQGFDFWFSLDDIRAVASHVDEFMVETNEEQLLPVYFAPCEPGTTGAQLLTVAEISAKFTIYGNIRKPLDIRQLGALLKKMGYRSARSGNREPRGYIVLEKSADSINAQRKIGAITAISTAPVEPIEPIEPILF